MWRSDRHIIEYKEHCISYSHFDKQDTQQEEMNLPKDNHPCDSAPPLTVDECAAHRMQGSAEHKVSVPSALRVINIDGLNDTNNFLIPDVGKLYYCSTVATK